MFKRSAFILLGGAALALTSVVGLGSPAQAATGALILDPISLTPGTTHVLPQTISAGECRQVGENQGSSQIPSYFTVTKSATIANLYTFTWNPTLYTNHTYDNDVWHAKFVFRNAAGPSLSLNFDGPNMSSDVVYHPSMSANFVMTQAQADSITFVDWIGDC
jgi:hypothetical protein